MDRKAVTQFLDEAETRYPVQQWEIDGVHIWPIVKFDIFSRWRATQNQQYDALLKKGGAKKKREGRMLSLMKSFSALARLLLMPGRKLSFITTGASSHRIDFGGSFINRYFQPMVEYMRDHFQQEIIHVEYTPRIPGKKYNNSANTIFLETYFPAVQALMALRPGGRREKLQDFKAFLDEVNDKMPGMVAFENYRKRMRAKAKAVKIYGFVYDVVYRKYKPGFVLELCYYIAQVYGANMVARRRGIPTIDIQHGGIGFTHPAYNAYTRVPAGGFNVMPEVFWCWDQSSANVLNQWMKHQHFHRAVIGGNPWLSYFAEREQNSLSFPDKKIILYTMQLNFPEEYIIEAIKQTQSDYQWWLRMHPRTLGVKKALVEFLTAQGVADKVNIDDATAYPLPQVMQRSVIHISRSSGSIIEAAQLGIKTIIIHDIGVAHYKDYIDSQDAIPFLSASAEGLLKIIRDNVQNPPRSKHGYAYDYKPVLQSFLNKTHHEISR